MPGEMRLRMTPRRQAPEQGNHGAAHSFGIEDQNDRCIGLLCQVKGRGLHAGSSGAVKIAHNTFNDSYARPVFGRRACQSRRCGICGIFRVRGGEEGVQVAGGNAQYLPVEHGVDIIRPRNMGSI